MAYRKVDDASLASVADAIRSKGSTSDGLVFPEGFVSAISAIQAGGGGGSAPSAKQNDVTFIDYDGSILYSYSLAEAQALTELPALPSHDGLICQGWNWTLENIKALNRPVTVGAMYITDDGATRLHIRIATIGRMTVPLYIGQTVANGVSIDWGDGSTAETLAGTGYVNTSHTYAEPGDYTISLMPEDGCTLSLGADPSSYYCVMGSTGNNSRVYCNMLQKVYIGKNVNSIGFFAFWYCQSLASITIPNGVTDIGSYTFAYCYSLTSITIPDGVTSTGEGTFAYCYSLTSITIPDGVTLIGESNFSECHSLASITIPDGVTFIGDYAFESCYSLESITIPDGVTSVGGSIFGNCCSLTSIAIPDGTNSIVGSAFLGCYSLASITIPDGTTHVFSNAFKQCYGMRYYDFSACTTVPTLVNTNAFDGIPSDCQMLIPAALYDEWSAAKNWATYAKYMVSV